MGLGRRMRKMGSKEIILFLMVSFHFCYLASSLPQNLISASARLQENVGEKETDERKTSTHDEKIIAHRGNLAVGGRGGGGSRGRSGSRGSGKGGKGGSSSTPKGPKTAAGAAFIPLYAAGAANGHNHHHGAASCNRIPTLSAVIILASLVVHINLHSTWK